MFRFLAKYKSLLILAAIVFASLVWMTSQVRSPGRSSLLEKGVAAAAYPFVRAVDAFASTARGVWEGYIFMVGLARDNDRLTSDNGRLVLENTRLKEELARGRRLDALASLKETAASPSIPARVIGRDASSWFSSIWVSAGEGTGVRKNMPAIAPGGLVGKVVAPFGSSSRVMLVTDPASSVSCVLQRSRDTGILAGNGTALCSLRYVGRDADVKVGDMVVTSGLDGVFPADLPVGRVKKVSKESSGYFLDVRVAPSADLMHLEELLVIMYEPQARK